MKAVCRKNLSQNCIDYARQHFDIEKRNKILREFVDVSTVIRSMEYAARFTDTEIAQMQRWVNRHNRERGYMDEPERQTDSHEKGKD